MKIIKIDDFFSNLTVDSTKITVDNTQITVDTVRYYDDEYRIEILPRKDATDVIVKINYDLENITLTTIARVRKGLLNIKLVDFIPVPETTYNVEVFNLAGEEIWTGQIMYTTQETQNYQLNNSDENKLRF